MGRGARWSRGAILSARSDGTCGAPQIGAPVDQLRDETLLAGFAADDPELATAFLRCFQARVCGT
jgi:hypothetical protein